MTDPFPNTNRNVSALSCRLGADPRFEGVGIVRSRALSGTGTLIAPRWILTAKHVVQQAKEGSFFLKGTNVPISRFVLHPFADLALGELVRAAEGYPTIPFWTLPTDPKQPIWLVGYGQHGEFTGKPAELSPRFQDDMQPGIGSRIFYFWRESGIVCESGMMPGIKRWNTKGRWPRGTAVVPVLWMRVARFTWQLSRTGFTLPWRVSFSSGSGRTFAGSNPW